MKTIVKYVVLKDLDYQLGTQLFQDEIDADATYFDQIPNVITYQNLKFKVKSKELKRVFVVTDPEEVQHIIVRVVAV